MNRTRSASCIVLGLSAYVSACAGPQRPVLSPNEQLTADNLWPLGQAR